MKKYYLKLSILLLCVIALSTSCEKPNVEDDIVDPSLEGQSNVNENSGWKRINHVIYSIKDYYGVDGKGKLKYHYFEAVDGKCYLAYSEYIETQQDPLFLRHRLASFDANGTLLDTISYGSSPSALAYKFINGEFYRIAGTITDFGLYKGFDLISKCPQSPWAGTPTQYMGDNVQWVNDQELLGYRLEQAMGANDFDGNALLYPQFYTYKNGNWDFANQHNIKGIKVPKGTYSVLGLQQYKGDIYAFCSGFEQLFGNNFKKDSLVIAIAKLNKNAPTQSDPTAWAWDSIYVGKIPTAKNQMQLSSTNKTNLFVAGSTSKILIHYDDFNQPYGSQLVLLSFDLESKSFGYQTTFIDQQSAVSSSALVNDEVYIITKNLSDASIVDEKSVYKIIGNTLQAASKGAVTKFGSSINQLVSGNGKLYGIFDNSGVITSKNGVIYITTPE